ncbi:MAG: hypothetical protein FJ151_03260, partial [Euryarchaeota archaeon]|nr:hypothetical protein [Euryarchaeota archaeon]
MEGGREALEGGWRLTRVRRIKMYLYIIQVVFLFVVAIFLVVTGQGFSLKPFYLPVNSFIYFVLIMGIIVGVESFIFRVIEIRLAKSASSKYFMAKRFTRRSLLIILICAIVIVILWVPFISHALEETLSTNGTVSSVVQFSNKDPLGLTGINKVTITSSGKTANVYVLTEESYLKYRNDTDLLRTHRINVFDYSVDASNPSFSFEFPEAAYGEFFIVVEDLGGSPSPLSYKLHNNISRTFLNYVPLFAILFIVVYAAAIVYLQV